jgi:hypothetical protein
MTEKTAMEVIAGVDRDADEGGPYSVGEGLADDILASLDAAGFQIVPLELPANTRGSITSAPWLTQLGVLRNPNRSHHAHVPRRTYRNPPRRQRL